MPTLEERLDMLESQHNRLADEVRTNNAMTAEMYGVFQEMRPGFKFMSDAYSVLSSSLKWISEVAKILIPVLMIGYMLYMLVTKGMVPVGL